MSAGFMGQAASSLAAQTPPRVEIADCSRPCPAVHFTKIGEIGPSRDAPVLLSWRSIPNRLPNGGWVTTATYEPGTVAFYRPDGSFDRTIGREGAGPGEFSGRGSEAVLARTPAVLRPERSSRLIDTYLEYSSCQVPKAPVG